MGTIEEVGGQVQIWLDRLQAGDVSARHDLIEYCCERLRLLSVRMMRQYRRLHRWEEADDVFQDAMLRLHRSLTAVQPESAQQFFALAATQIRRTLLDLARRYFGPQGHGARRYVDVEQARTVASDGPASLQQWTEFHEALATLPAEERTVVDLLWFEGLTHAEAALALGISERSTRRIWHSARCLLHRALSHE